ncbi:MAG: hypothetical protein CM15mP19_05870 [Gammaproteobacteria bacterium]|nr:MAG: hypothetical protein CM15mP19_05870 [Gammaproteobacteria bacterium]
MPDANFDIILILKSFFNISKISSAVFMSIESRTTSISRMNSPLFFLVFRKNLKPLKKFHVYSFHVFLLALWLHKSLFGY